MHDDIITHLTALWEVYTLASSAGIASAHIAAWYEARFWAAL